MRGHNRRVGFFSAGLMLFAVSGSAIPPRIPTQLRPSDANIAYEVESRIEGYAFYTIYDNVDVAVNEGRVILTGEVLAEARARAIANLAAGARGVVAVDNLLRIIVTTPKDDDVRYEIAARIYSNPMFGYSVSPGPIHIVVESGRVKLTGIVPSELEREMAEMLTSGVPGIVRLENRIRCLTDE